jgi:hypothetical protein
MKPFVVPTFPIPEGREKRFFYKYRERTGADPTM